MIRKRGLIYFLTYYNVIPFIILAIVFYFSKDFLFNLFCSLLELNKGEIFYSIYLYLSKFILIFLWFLIVFAVSRERRYRYITNGRCFFKDQGRYKRTYKELVDYFKESDPHRLNTSIFLVKSIQNTSGIIFGKDDRNRLIHIPSDSECNIAIFGPPGSGKTSGIGIINAMTFSGSVLAVDIKGDIYSFVSSHTNRKILRFCPDHPDALKVSVHFDPLADINKMNVTDKKLYLESMATILIPEDGNSTDGNYFCSRARKMLQGIVHLLLFNNPNSSFPDIIHAILTGNIFEWVTKAMESDCEPAKEFLSSFYGNSEKNVTSAYDQLVTSLINFSNPILDELLTSNKNCISAKHLEKGYDIYLQISQEHLDAYAPLFTLIIQSFSTAFTRRPDSSSGIKNRPILMLLDEFPQLTFSYKLINSNLSTLRSKSVICMIIQQSFAQLEHRYQNTGARSIIGNCNYQVILGSNDIESSKRYSDTFGSRKILKISNSETLSQNASTGRSIQEATEKVFSPEHFGDLPSFGKMVLYFKGKYTECNKFNCYKDFKNNETTQVLSNKRKNFKN